MTTTIGSLDVGALSDLREDVTQYFWFESDSTSAWGSGAHVTLYPESQFTNPNNANYMKGQNIIMNTDGFSIRNGSLPMMVLDNDSLDFNAVDINAGTYTTLATFGLTGATIGKTTGAHSVIDANGQRFYGSDGTTQLANIGYDYGEGRDDNDGITIAPYYTFGTRYITTSEYNPNIVYDIGALCVYDNKVYVCIVQITSPEQWTPSHWQYYIGNYSLAEGLDVIASGVSSHAEGWNTMASGYESHAEGFFTIASGNDSHAEGDGTIASGDQSHAEGWNTTASGVSSHAEGYETIASGHQSHAEGWYTRATGNYSHAGGRYTVANMSTQIAIGTWNIQDSTPSQAVHPNGDTSYGNYALIIGNGTSEHNRSNALTVAWDSTVAFGDPSRTFIVEEYTKSYSAISSGGVLNWSDPKSKTGYYPVGVVGFRTNMQALVVNMVKLSSVQSGSCTINMNARAVANVPAGTAQMYVLWIKET